MDAKLEDDRVALRNPKSRGLHDTLSSINRISSEVTTSRAFHSNAKIFVKATEVALEQAQSLDHNLSQFTADVFVAKLVGRLCADGLDEEEDSFDSLRKSFSWRTVGAAAGDIMNDAPSIDVMFGPMTSLKRKARVVQSRAKKVKIGELKKAGRVEQSEEEEVHTKLMQELVTEIDESKGFRLFWPFVIKNDMANTVQTIFACCHLAKDGALRLVINENARDPEDGERPCEVFEAGELLIGPTDVGMARAAGEDAAAASSAGTAAAASQFVMGFDALELRAKEKQYAAELDAKKGGRKPTLAQLRE